MWATQIFALCFIGVGAALAFIPCMPDSAPPGHPLSLEGTTRPPRRAPRRAAPA